MSSSLSRRLGSILGKEDMSDVFFAFPSESVRTTRRIPGHKIILSTGSPVFKAMFYGSMAEKGEEVEIVDVSAKAFLIMLSFLYTDEVVLDIESAIETMYAAKKYDIPGLLNESVDFLLNSIDKETAVLIYENTLLFDETKLTDRCLEVMDRNAHHMINTNPILSQITYPLLCLLLKRSTFCAREIDIFDAVIWWSKKQLPADKHSPSDIRKVLKDAFFSIRFPRMTLKEIVQIVVPTGLLESSELVDVLNYFKKDSQSRKEKQLSPLFTVDRRWLNREIAIKVGPANNGFSSEQDLNVGQTLRSRYESSANLRSMRLMFNERVFLTKLVLSSVPFRYSTKGYVAVVRLLDLDLNEMLFAQSYSFKRIDDIPKPAHYEFKLDPVELCPRINYDLCVTIESVSVTSQNVVSMVGPFGDNIIFQCYYNGEALTGEAEIQEIYVTL